VQVIARSAGDVRLDPSRITDFTLVGSAGQRIPLSQIGTVKIRMEEPILRRRDRTPTITVRGDIADGLQPPDVSTALWKALQPVVAKLPAGYRIEEGGSIEESGKANRAMAPLFPIMIALKLITIIFQVRSISAMAMVVATAPLGLVGVVPTLLLFDQPFGFNALIGLRSDCAFWNSDAQHADPDRPDPHQRGGSNGAVRCCRRSHGPARPSGHPDGARRHVGVHSAHPLGLLGNARV
jgi:multidrug efflux pump subunit AcrB